MARAQSESFPVYQVDKCLYARMRLPRKSMYVCLAIIAIITYGIFLRISVTEFSREIVPGDEVTYHNAALSLMRDGVIVRNPYTSVDPSSRFAQPSSALAPGYPVFLAALYGAFGGSSFSVFVAHVILSAGSLILIVQILKTLGVATWALIAATAVAAVYPGLVYNLDRMLTETLFVFLSLIFAALIVRYIKYGGLRTIGLAALTVGYAIQVRSQALPLASLALVFCVIYAPGALRRKLWEAFYFIAIVALTMLPWLMYTAGYFDRPMLLPGGGEGAMIWGAVPYYLDLNAATGRGLAEVAAENAAVDPLLYWSWRTFGYLQYMWFDFWDENLAHPAVQLKMFWLVHHLIIVPTLCMVPYLIYKGRPEHIFVATIPILVTYSGALFHGLPRYAFPAVSFLILAFGCLGGIKGTTGTSNARKIRFDSLTRWCVCAAALPLSLMVAYSVGCFSWKIAEEMSRYRIQKYSGADIDKLKLLDDFEPLKLSPGDFTIGDASPLPNGMMKNDLGVPATIGIDVRAVGDDARIVTKVELDVDRSSYFDYVAIYWKTKSDVGFSESKVYRPPASRFIERTTVYLDGDVTKILIVPVYFRNQIFTVRSIIVEKLTGIPGGV